MSAIQRPILISIVCVKAFLWMFISFVKVFAPSIKKLGIMYPPVYGLIIALLFISIVGIWHMKKWGTELFILMSFLKLSFLFVIDDFDFSTYVGIFFTVAYISILLSYYKKMDSNL